MQLKTENIQRIVVRGTNWVGDAVMTVPALRGLRHLFPKAHITLATRPWTSGVFEETAYLDDLLIHDSRGMRSISEQVGAWRKRKFDLAMLFTNSFEAALVAFLARVPFRTGYATDRRSILLTHPLILPEWRSSRHEIFFYLNIVAELERLLGREQTIIHREPDCSLEISNFRKEAARDFLHSNGVREDCVLVALCPGSINSRAKRWPTERYAVLADRLTNDLSAQVILIGSGAELDVSLEVASQMQNSPVILTGKTELADLVAILSLMDLLVTNDTGPAHVAPALGRPTLVIFGPTDPKTTRPYASVADIVHEPPECAPCMLRDCPIDHRCMTAITSDDVFERAAAMLSDKLQFVI